MEGRAASSKLWDQQPAPAGAAEGGDGARHGRGRAPCTDPAPAALVLLPPHCSPVVPPAAGSVQSPCPGILQCLCERLAEQSKPPGDYCSSNLKSEYWSSSLLLFLSFYSILTVSKYVRDKSNWNVYENNFFPYRCRCEQREWISENTISEVAVPVTKFLLFW